MTAIILFLRRILWGLAVVAALLVPGCGWRAHLPAAQRALRDVQISISGDAGVVGAVSAEYIAVSPRGETRMTLDLPLIGEAWALDTARHPGPWYYRIELFEERGQDFVRLVAVERSEACRALHRLSCDQAVAAGVSPLPPSSPRLAIPANR